MQAEFCKALANEHRLAIMYHLAQGEMCVSDLARMLQVPVYTLSQHLRVLKERMLVRPRKEGQSVYYSITNPTFIEGCRLIRKALVEQHRAAGMSLLAARFLDGASTSEETARPAPARAALEPEHLQESRLADGAR